MGQTRARFHSNGSREDMTLISTSSFMGRAITSFVPFKNSAVRLSGPQDRPVFKFSIPFTISSISGGRNSEDGPTRPGGRGWQGTRRLGNKHGSKVFRKGVSNFSIIFQYFSLVIYGIYAGASWKGPVYVGPKTLGIFAYFEPKGGLKMSRFLENYFRTIPAGWQIKGEKVWIPRELVPLPGSRFGPAC